MFPAPVPSLTLAGCRARQQRLREELARRDLEGALLSDRRHLQYFCGYWHPAPYAAAALIRQEGPTLLSVPFPLSFDVAADELRTYPSNFLGTLQDDQAGKAVAALADQVSTVRHLGRDLSVPGRGEHTAREELLPFIHTLRRRKDADEVALIRRAIQATEAAYAFAREALRAGVDETDLFAGMLQAAAADCGEIIGEFGNDFQVGGLGGPPRRRAALAGEMAVFDLSVRVRGYYSDMCRSFVVGGAPSAAQTQAHARVMEVLAALAEQLQPGVSCRALFEQAHAQLDGYAGWAFMHHLGHGVGLNGHEGPRLNPHWDDVLEEGNIIAVEPGLYGPALRVGLRVEQMYLITPGGAEQLTSFPTDLA